MDEYLAMPSTPALALRKLSMGTASWAQKKKASIDSFNEYSDVFAAIDADQNGHLDAEEVQKAMANIFQVDLSLEEVYSMIHEVDEDGDNKIDLNEFTTMIDRMKESVGDSAIQRKKNSSLWSLFGTVAKSKTLEGMREDYALNIRGLHECNISRRNKLRCLQQT